MYWHLRKGISSVTGLAWGTQEVDQELTEMLRAFYFDHLDWSLAMTVALVGIDDKKLRKVWKSRRDVEVLDKIEPDVQALRRANLVRHHYVASPLINYADDDGDWTTPRVHWKGIHLSNRRLEASPRFIHLDEFSHAEFLVQVGGDRDAAFATKYFESQIPESGGEE